MTASGSDIKWTERAMLDLLHKRFSHDSGNGERWVRAEHVRAACGFAGYSFEGGMAGAGRRVMRTADFLAQDCWEARGMELHGVEVKVSRSDWLHELADPTKADAIRRYCDRWWLAVPDKGIVRNDLPDGWGLLTVGKDGKLRASRSAPKLDPEPMPATFRAALMRAVAKTERRRSSDHSVS